MTIRHFVDNAPTVNFAAPLGAGDLTGTVNSLVGFPTSFPYTATIDLGTASAEVVEVTSASGATVTFTRNFDGNGALSHLTGATFDHTAVALDFSEANAHINATTGVHGTTGALVDTSSVQTLTNKTIAGLSFTAAGGTPGFVVSTDGTSRAFEVHDGGSTVSWFDGVGGAAVAHLQTTGSTVLGNETMSGTLGVSGATSTGPLTVTSGGATIAGAASADSGTANFVAHAQVHPGEFGGGGSRSTLMVANTASFPTVASHVYKVRLQWADQETDGTGSSSSMGQSTGSGGASAYSVNIYSSGTSAAANFGSPSVVNINTLSALGSAWGTRFFEVFVRFGTTGTTALGMGLSGTSSLYASVTSPTGGGGSGGINTNGLTHDLVVWDLGLASNFGM